MQIGGKREDSGKIMRPFNGLISGNYQLLILKFMLIVIILPKNKLQYLHSHTIGFTFCFDEIITESIMSLLLTFAQKVNKYVF